MAWTAPATCVPGQIVNDVWKNAYVRDNLTFLYDRRKLVYKASDEFVNNNNTPQADDDLVFTVAAGEYWQFLYVLDILQGASAVPDFQYEVRTTGSFFSCTYGHAAELSAAVQATDNSSIWGGMVTLDVDNNERKVVAIKGCLHANAAGTITLYWAQQNALAVNTTVKAGSCLMAYRLAA